MITLRRILVPTDFGDAAQAALQYARELAREFHAAIDVLHVCDNVLTRGFGIEGYAAAYPDLQRDVEASARNSLDALLTSEDRFAFRATPVVLTSNTPALAIISYAQ